MKLFRPIAIMLLLAGLFTSCKKSLTIQPENRTVADGYYDSAQKIEQAVIGGYVDLRRALLANYAWLMYGEARTGDLVINVDYQQAVASQRLKADHRYVKQLTDWGYFYDVIRDANDLLAIIDKADNSTLNTNQRNLFKGEALALKSAAYFYLGRIWGDVPSAETKDYGKRLTSVEAITLASSFATQAKPLLPWRLINDDGIESVAITGVRFSRTSATTMLAHQQLWLGKSQDAFTLLSGTFTTATTDSLSSFGLSLGADRRTVLPEQPLGSTSSLVSVPLDRLNVIYTTGDARRTTMFNISASLNKATLIVKDPTILELFSVREINLLLAEAAWRSGRLDEGKVYLVKAAAGATENYNNLTAATFGDALLTERRRMLVGTGQRVFDLMRFSKVSTFISALTETDVQQGAAFWPLSENSLRGNSLIQNSYWLSKN
jgi:hypothetical protein